MKALALADCIKALAWKALGLKCNKRNNNFSIFYIFNDIMVHFD